MINASTYDSLVNALKNKAAEILPPGSRLGIYGSRARGDARDTSDWDIHILIPNHNQQSFADWDDYGWPFMELGFDLNADINPQVYSYSDWNKRKKELFYKNVEKDIVILFKN